jgi:hypothetical protein
MVFAHFIAFTWISNMAAAAILKAVGHFRCCIFDYGWKTRNYSSNFIGIRWKLTELLQFEFFHNGGCRHLGLDDRWPLTRNLMCTFWLPPMVQILCRYLLIWLRYELLLYFRVWLGNHRPRPLFGGFWGLLTPSSQIFSMRPRKGTSLGGIASFEPSTMEIGSPVWPVEVSKKIIWKERKGLKGLQAMHKKSQKCYISRSCGGWTPGAISMKFGPLVHMVNVINCAKFDHCNSIGLDLARV